MKGEVVTFQMSKATEIREVRWMYKRDACLLSTIHNSEMKTGRVMNKFQNLKKPFHNDRVGGVGTTLQTTQLSGKERKNIIKRFFLPY